MNLPRRPADLDETVLDEGRQRLFPSYVGARLVETLIDQGRRRPVSGSQPEEWPDDGLPEFLTARYELIGRLDVRASQGSLQLVRVRSDGTTAVLKRHHAARHMDPDLLAHLAAPGDHVVRHLEAGWGYEVMAYAPGASLREQLATDLRGFSFAELQTVIAQISTGLIALHGRGFVHRDVKPANIVIRASEAVHVTLVDFGIAGPIGAEDWPDEPNLAYQPPEWSNLRRVGAATDWWGLGVTVLELASGEHPFEGLADEDIRGHFGTARAVDVSGVPADPAADGGGRRDRLRNLCQGLLALDPAARWGEEQVRRWLVGENPELPDLMIAHGAGSSEAAADRPYVFAGTAYHRRDDLAAAMSQRWDHAVGVLFENCEIVRLREWLDQFADDDGAEARGVADAAAADTRNPGDVRLLRVLQSLDPTRSPVYRNHPISRRHLMQTARLAMDDEGDNALVLAELWNYRLLPDFDSAAHSEAGGEDLAEIDRRWRCAHADWPALIEQVTDAAARNYLLATVSERGMIAVCLRSALCTQKDLDRTRRELLQGAAALPARQPWFERLVRDPATIWVAVLLLGHATNRASDEANRIASSERAQDTVRTEAAFREWSRRQNRPAALGWAVAGVCPVAAIWIVLITISDFAQRASDTAIGLAWVCASICLGVILVAESLLAAEIGGQFHPRYSIPGATRIALRSVGGWMRRSWLPAAATILGAAAGIGLLTLEFPQLLIAATTVGEFGWLVRRLSAWSAQVTATNAQIAASELRRPSDTDAAPVGATGGVGS